YSMFANLVKNAIEASPPGSVVGISLKRENGSIVAEVHNPGEVPEAMRGRFFQKYATTGKSAGLGLGTYSARLMARVQEGELSLETSPAQGTRLVARMKVAGPDLPRAVENRAAASERAATGGSLPAHNVLVVDDDEFNRLVLRRYLPAPPLRVAFAVNGRAAVEPAAKPASSDGGAADTESASSEAASADTVLVDEDLKATLPDFLRSRGELLDEMPAALAAGDRTHFKRCAHRLAGSFALYGFAGAAAECRAIEHDAQEGERRDLEQRVAAVRAYLDRVTIEYAPAKGALSAGKA